MQKISVLILCVIIFSGCSVLRKRNTEYKQTAISKSEGRILVETGKNNVTNTNFFIQKALVTLEGSGGEDKFIATLKYLVSGKYLLSLRTRTGIEISRILITKDTILANDRINRKTYFGKSDYFMKRYKLTPALLPLIFGDLYEDGLIGKINPDCSEGFVEVEGYSNGVKLKYKIDCNIQKCVQIERVNDINQASVRLEYSSFFKEGNILIPGRISVEDKETNTGIVIEIERIEMNWVGDIDFIGGKGYELIEF